MELAAFMYHDLYEKLAAFGIQQIDRDKIILKPYLLKKKTGRSKDKRNSRQLSGLNIKHHTPRWKLALPSLKTALKSACLPCQKITAIAIRPAVSCYYCST